MNNGEGAPEEAYNEVLDNLGTGSFYEYLKHRTQILVTPTPKDDSEYEQIWTYKGFIAPEVARRKNYDQRIDIWAAGAIFYLMLARVHPYEKHIYQSTEGYIKSIAELNEDEKEPNCDIIALSQLPSKYKRLLSRLLRYNPDERFSMKLQFEDTKILGKQYKTYLKSKKAEEQKEVQQNSTDEIDAKVEEAKIEAPPKPKLHPNENKNLMLAKFALYKKFFYLCIDDVRFICVDLLFVLETKIENIEHFQAWLNPKTFSCASDQAKHLF